MLLVKRIEELEKSRGNAVDVLAFSWVPPHEDALMVIEYDGVTYAQSQGDIAADWLNATKQAINSSGRAYVWVDFSD
jgi:hypothetical protein